MKMLDSTKFRFLQTLKYWKIFLFSNSNNFGKLEREFSVTFIKMSLSVRQNTGRALFLDEGRSDTVSGPKKKFNESKLSFRGSR